MDCRKRNAKSEDEVVERGWKGQKEDTPGGVYISEDCKTAKMRVCGVERGKKRKKISSENAQNLLIISCISGIIRVLSVQG